MTIKEHKLYVLNMISGGISRDNDNGRDVLFEIYENVDDLKNIMIVEESKQGIKIQLNVSEKLLKKLADFENKDGIIFDDKVDKISFDTYKIKVRLI